MKSKVWVPNLDSVLEVDDFSEGGRPLSTLWAWVPVVVQTQREHGMPVVEKWWNMDVLERMDQTVVMPW